MIILTEAAKSRFQTLRPEERAEGEALRLDRARATINNGDEPKLAVYLGEPEEGDDPVEYEGEPLLYISRKVSAAFDESQLSRFCVVRIASKCSDIVNDRLHPPRARTPSLR